jgi:hypothetical protein
MGEAKTFEGSCHCGAVRYTAPTARDDVISCNWSICARAGTLLTFVPAARFELLSGAEALGDYQFGARKIHHHFCTTCGIRPFGKGQMPDGQPIVAVNVRCLEGVDLGSLHVTQVDGKSF